jgi:excisionase family DNA binding protein
MRERLLTLPEAAEILNVSMSQMRALVTSGELPGVQIGGRRVWRVEPADLDAYIDGAKQRTAERVRTDPRAVDFGEE